ncbi:MAG TPA: integrase core domain-containing protein, partial [Polyangiaceae bacterium]|nr:integrase core domain-containing protein [Polyangiaceae bacterium]
VAHERIRPGHPEENGRHERMHRTLKLETARPARANLLQQQEAFDDFLEVFNTKRPHEALDMRRPAEVYQTSARPYPTTMPEPSYPLHDDTLFVSKKGALRIAGVGTVYLAQALADHPVGIREEDDGSYLVSFLDLDLGHVVKNRPFQPLYPATPGNQQM